MTTPLPIKGQGVFLFRVAPYTPSVQLRIHSDDPSVGWIIQWTADRVEVTEVPQNAREEDPACRTGLSTHSGAFYWISVDAQNQRLSMGVGEPRAETTIYRVSFSHAKKPWIESMLHLSYPAEVVPLGMLKDPVLPDPVPLKVKGMDALTMEDIALGAVMPASMLPIVSLQLYQCISGSRFILDSPDFPEFSEAIEYSIQTPGGWCYEMLRKKSTEFNPDKPDLSETYLRITLGPNQGESPGVPYVMEIWPVGHYSPIHRHSDANAIIRVLHGEIDVSLYPYLCAERDGVPPFSTATFSEGDITWLTPTCNQIHQLKNADTNVRTCITIQCYLYSDTDVRHYDDFDYIDANGQQQSFEPNSDMDFLTFKEQMRSEWKARPSSRWCCF